MRNAAFLGFPLAVLIGSGACLAAEPFAAAGTKAVLTVDYAYASSGRKSSEGMYDPYEWKVERTVSLEARLAAQAPTAMPTVQAIDSSQMAQLQGKSRKAQAIGTQMAPMHMDIEKMVARCGDDEACMTREIQKMGSAMANDPAKMAAIQGTKKDVDALTAPDALRYQAWRPTAQKGTYRIDERVHISNPDPICMAKPRHRCTREETRIGSGEVPVPAAAYAKGNEGAAAGLSAAEVDAAKGTLTLTLPAPLGMLAYTETITTDEPEGTHDKPTPKGAHKREAFFRVSGTGSGFMHEKPLTVALKGGWRSQQGEYTVPLKGSFGDAGTLHVRWRFAVQ